MAEATEDDESCTYPEVAFDCNGVCLFDFDGDSICDQHEEGASWGIAFCLASFGFFVGGAISYLPKAFRLCCCGARPGKV